ncbi:MAG: PPOX class F420-dependent oxidoreductase [Solirubrobacteraceae bacterium]
MNLRALENRVYGGVKDAHAADVTQRDPRPWSLASLSGHKYCLLTSFRKSGAGVSTPVWFGIDGDRVYVRSGGQDGKVKRIRRDSRVLVTPCTARGRPLGDPMEGTARLLGESESKTGERALQARYGLGRRVYRLLRRRLDVAYIEVSAAPGSSADE